MFPERRVRPVPACVIDPAPEMEDVSFVRPFWVKLIIAFAATETVRAEFDRLLGVKPPKENWHRLGVKRDETWLAAAGALVDKVQSLPMRADYAYVEPSELRGIRQARGRRPGLRKWTGSPWYWRMIGPCPGGRSLIAPPVWGIVISTLS